jgi:hypothetical protein
MPKATPPMLRCQTPACVGVLGTVRDGDLYPAAHLIPGRHLWFERPGVAVLVCTFCKREHRLTLATPAPLAVTPG